MLSSSQRDRVEVRLREERDRAVEALREFDETRDESLQEELGELSSYRLHPADIGSETMEQEQQFLLASAEGRRLSEIDEALRRLSKEPEDFGRCERCGREIGMERLEVVPATTLCADCQRLVESQEPG
jgi:DnaK suppressor protein